MQEFMLRLQWLEATFLPGHMMAMFIVWIPLLGLNFGMSPLAFFLLLALRAVPALP